MESKNRKSIIANSDTQSEKKLSRLLELAERAERRGVTIVSDFLTPDLIQKAKIILKRESLFSLLVVDGGYEGAERQKMVFAPYPEEFERTAYFSCLQISWNKYAQGKIRHGDVLGSILALGIKREKIGDIIIDDEKAYLVHSPEISDFLLLESFKIHRYEVEKKLIVLKNLNAISSRSKPITGSVSSCRLDTIGSLGFSISRKNMADQIKNGKVRLNWQEVKKNDREVKPGDVISCRGQGKIIFKEELGKTLKGRIKIEIMRLL